MRNKRYLAAAVLAVSGLVGVTACGYDYGGNEEIRFNEEQVKAGAGNLDNLNKNDAAQQGKDEEADANDKAAAAKDPDAANAVKDDKAVVDDKAEVKVDGTEVNNLREDIAKNAKNFCEGSVLDAGEGLEDKGGTCVSSQIGEIAKNPVLIAMPGFPNLVAEGTTFKVNVEIEDKFGPIDLNAFTNIDGKASTTFLEHPGELDNNGRPLLHAHFGVTTLKEDKGLPKTNDYDAAFSGVQGVEGKPIEITVSALKAGFYRADVYAGQPGHAPLVTAKANQVQAFSSVYFEVK